jgi:hypothetical protein
MGRSFEHERDAALRVAIIGTGQGGKPLAVDGAFIAMDPAISMLSGAKF